MTSKRGVLGSLLLNTVETKLFNKEKSQIVETSKVFKCSAAYLRLLVRTIKHDWVNVFDEVVNESTLVKERLR